jgi:predicted PurR-regulated permease PerM
LGRGMANDTLNRTLKVLATIALALLLAAAVGAFLHRIIAVLIVLLGAVFASYLVYPLVRRFSRRMPRWLAIVCVYAIFAAAIVGFALSVGPRIAFEARGLAHDFPRIMQAAQDDFLSANIAVLGTVPLEARESAARLFENAGAQLQQSAMTFVGQAVGILLSMASIVTAFIIIPILTFYILMDLERLHAGMLRIIPARYHAVTALVLHDVDAVLGGFIRGQIIVGAIVAVLITILLLALRIKYAFLIGLFAGVVDIIPYLGAIAGAIPAIIIAALTHGFGWALLVTAGFVGVYQLEGHIIAPNVVGQRVGLTPLMVIVAILIGAELAGIIGMFFAVPIAGIIRALAHRFLPQTDRGGAGSTTTPDDRPKLESLREERSVVEGRG